MRFTGQMPTRDPEGELNASNDGDGPAAMGRQTSHLDIPLPPPIGLTARSLSFDTISSLSTVRGLISCPCW
jgi:hypothetical protein